MSENTSTPSEQPYDPDRDPDADPDMLGEQRPKAQGENQRDQAEGDDDAAPTG